MKPIRKERLSRTMSRCREIYRFGGPWARAALAAVPWVNVLVLVGLLFMVHGRLVMTPGMMFDLPSAPLREGMLSGRLTALMISVDRENAGGDETLIFFDDDRYSAQDADQLAVLSERLRSRLSLQSHFELLLLADKRVPHGDVIRFVNVAREAGVQRVCVAEKPE